MNNLALLSLQMACKDWFHEASLSFCGVLALASMLSPLLILHGVHNGIIEHMRENLMRDPAVMVLIPIAGKGAGFDEEFIEKLSTVPGLRFGIGRTRAVASELQMRAPDNQLLTLTLDATAPGDPLLDDYGIKQPVSTPGKLEIVLSHTAARRLAVNKGDTVSANIARRLSSGKFKSIKLDLLVKDVLPQIAMTRETGFVDLPTLNAIQDFRDGIDSDLLQIEGEQRPPQKRYFESFRVYAASLDDVPVLEKWFKEQGITMQTRSRDIAIIKKIDSALGSVIGLIIFAGCAGFFAFMGSTARAAARRKWKQMGMLKLIGFHKRSVLVFPVCQSLLTGLLGCLSAFIIYSGVAYTIDYMFADATSGAQICHITFGFFCLALSTVLLLAVFASLGSALKAAAISPSTVIRDS